MAFDITIGRNESDMKLLGKEGVVLIGKSYVKMGRTTSLSNPLYLDIARGHVIYIVGKRGSGKCISPDTKIQLADNSWLSAEKIYNKYAKGGKLTLKNSKETLFELKKGLNVKSMDKDLLLANMPVSHIYRKRVNENLYKICVNKREIIVTNEHPLLVSNGSCLYWCEAGKLQEKDLIAIPKKSETALALVSNEGYGYTATAQEVIFASISKIETMHYLGYVYDLTVPYTHNFIAGENGGIVCHNSYTMGAIAEGIMDLPDEVRNNLSMIMMDTMGVYWTMKYQNQKDEDLLELWGLQGKGMDVKIYTPAGFFQQYKDDGIPTDFSFAIKPSDLTSQDWVLGFELDQNSTVAIAIEKALGDMGDEGIKDYSISDIIERINSDTSFEQETRNEAINRFRAAERWGLFDEKGMDMMDLVQPGQISILDLSPYVATPGGWGIKALVLGLVGMRVFTQRMLARKAEELDAIKIGYSYFQAAEEMGNKEPLPIVWIVVDEAHEFLPKEGSTAATNALVTIMREGRQPGVCLMLATQQPGKIHTDVMSQSDIIIAHRLTAKPDVDALASMSQSYLAKGLPRLLDELPRVPGAALILDDNSERFYPMRVRPRLTWHGGAAPSAIKYKRKVEFEI